MAILKSANMSLGINTLFKVLKMVTPILAEAGFDMEIVEKLTTASWTLPAARRWHWRM